MMHVNPARARPPAGFDYTTAGTCSSARQRGDSRSFASTPRCLRACCSVGPLQVPFLRFAPSPQVSARLQVTIKEESSTAS